MVTEIAPLTKGSGLKRGADSWANCLAEFLGTLVLIAFG